MKLVLIFVVFLGLACLSYGWTSIEDVEVDKKVCKSADPDVGTLQVGTVTLRSCVRATCSPGRIDFAGCGVIGVEPPCYVGEIDPSKPYPDCCPKPVCPSN